MSTDVTKGCSAHWTHAIVVTCVVLFQNSTHPADVYIRSNSTSIPYECCLHFVLHPQDIQNKRLVQIAPPCTLLKN